MDELKFLVELLLLLRQLLDHLFPHAPPNLLHRALLKETLQPKVSLRVLRSRQECEIVERLPPKVGLGRVVSRLDGSVGAGAS